MFCCQSHCSHCWSLRSGSSTKNIHLCPELYVQDTDVQRQEEMTTPTGTSTFKQLASDEQIARTAKALEANGIKVLVAENGAEAKRLFFELVPDGSEVFLGAS